MMEIDEGKGKRQDLPMIFPTQYPTNNIVPVHCFFVYPATLLLTIVKLILNPKPWK
jgi:hypothetical protein